MLLIVFVTDDEDADKALSDDIYVPSEKATFVTLFAPEALRFASRTVIETVTLLDVAQETCRRCRLADRTARRCIQKVFRILSARLNIYKFGRRNIVPRESVGGCACLRQRMTALADQRFRYH